MSPASPPRDAAPKRIVASLFALALLASGCSRDVAMAPDLGHRVDVAPTSNGALEEIIVTMPYGVHASGLAADYGATIAIEEPWGCATMRPPAGETPAQLAQRMISDPRVTTVEPNGYLESPEARQQSFAFDDGLGNESNYREQDATTALRLEEAHDVGRGQGVLVAILDTGCDLTHPALANRIAGGWDYVDGDNDPSDVGDGIDGDGDGNADEAMGHGTHVAGIVAVTAPRARLLIIRVLDADGRGDMRSVASGIRYAMYRKARVINLSLGSLSTSQAVQKALEDARAQGIVNVASAGNWGAEQPFEFPARSPDALAVAAVDASDQAAPFTSYADYVALSAPGVGVRSTYRDGRYAIWSGTSMSAPFVSGVSALLLGVHPGWSQGDVRKRLEATARPLKSLAPSHENKLGAGALDAGAALLVDRRAPRGGGASMPRDTY